MNKRTRAVAIIVGMVFPILVVLTAMECAVFNHDFFLNELDQNNVSATTGIVPKELPTLTDQIFNFLKGTREDFNIYAEKENDLYVPLFNEKEQIHMNDVRGLLKAAVLIQVVCLLLFIVGLALLARWNPSATAKALFGGSIAGIVLLASVCVAGVLDFTVVFEAAHRLIFTNDFWYLDPAESVLINIVPEPYFVHLALKILIISSVVFLIGAVVCGYLSKKLTQKEFVKNKKRKF